MMLHRHRHRHHQKQRQLRSYRMERVNTFLSVHYLANASRQQTKQVFWNSCRKQPHFRALTLVGWLVCMCIDFDCALISCTRPERNKNFNWNKKKISTNRNSLQREKKRTKSKKTKRKNKYGSFAVFSIATECVPVWVSVSVSSLTEHQFLISSYIFCFVSRGKFSSKTILLVWNRYYHRINECGHNWRIYSIVTKNKCFCQRLCHCSISKANW